MKRLFSIITAFALCLSLLPNPVQAADGADTSPSTERKTVTIDVSEMLFIPGGTGQEDTGGIQIVNGTYSYIKKNLDNPTDVSDKVSATMENTDLIITGTTTLMMIKIDNSISAIGGTVTLKDLTIDNYDNGNVPLSIRKSSTEPTGENIIIGIEGDVELRSQAYSVQVVDSVKAELSGSGNFTAAARKGDVQKVITLQNAQYGGLSVAVTGDVTLKAEATGTQSTSSTADENFPIFVNEMLELKKLASNPNPTPRPSITIKGKSVTLIRTKEVSECESGTEYVKINENKSVETGVIVTSDTINQLSSINYAYDKKLELDLSNQTTDITYQNPFNTSQGYEWDATNKILTLNSFITPDTVTLPDANATIKIIGNCQIGSLTVNSTNNKDHLQFTGDGTLTVERQINISGNNDMSFTIDSGTTVVAQKGIYTGLAGVDSTVTVNGTLKANGGDGCALTAGKVAIGGQGELQVSGQVGVDIHGMPNDQFNNSFTITEGGTFTANCKESNIKVTNQTDSLPEGVTDVTGIISIPDKYLPAGYEMMIIPVDGKQQIHLAHQKEDGTYEIYAGKPLTVHQHTPPTPEAYQSDENHHWQECTECSCAVTEKAGHTSVENKATCQKKAVCDTCGVEYGELGQHNFSTTWSSDETNHWYACQTEGCTEQRAKVNHTYDRKITTDAYLKSDATCTEAAVYYKSCVCGAQGTETFSSGEPLGHNPIWEKNNEQHWHKCQRCSAITDTKVNHSYDRGKTQVSAATCTKQATYYQSCECDAEGPIFAEGPLLPHEADESKWVPDGDNHLRVCKSCGTKMTDTTEPHSFGDWQQVHGDAVSHWKECSLCHKKESQAHTPDHDAPTETDPVKCLDCGYIIHAALNHTHDWAEDWTTDETYHWHSCKGCNDEVDQKAEHTFGDWIIDEEVTPETDGSKHKECTVCGYETEREIIPKHEHSYDDTWQSDENSHWHECRCGEKSDEKEHIYDGDSDTTCNVCGYERTVNQPENPDSTYHITPDTTPEGTFTASPNPAQAGEIVTLTPKPAEGYHLVSLTVTDSEGTPIETTSHDDGTYTFTMPEGNVTVTTVFEKNSYNVTVDDSEQSNGTVDIDPNPATVGEKVTLTAMPNSGYHFKEWNVKSGNIILTDVEKTTNPLTFIMPAGDVKIEAVFEKDSVPSRPSGGGGGGGSSSSSSSITIEQPEHGKITSNRPSASRGTSVTLTVTPDDGYQMKSLTVTDSQNNAIKLTDQGDGKYTFTMPGAAIKVKAVFEPLPEPSKSDENNGDAAPALSYSDYTDLDSNAWYSGAVDYVLKAGLMQGYGDKTFAPNDTLSRAMLAQILYNREGKPATTGNSGFTDVTDGQWYAPAVAWAASKGIISGYNDGRFGSNDNITREQVTVMLWRYAGSPAAKNQELSFSDTDETSEWATDALRWAVENDILHGYNDGRLDPKGFITRAETAQMLQNYLK